MKRVVLSFIAILVCFSGFAQYVNLSQAEIDVFAERLIKGPYNKKGDVSANSPGDGDRIRAAAAKAMANPELEIWRKPTQIQVEEVVNGKKVNVTNALAANTPISKWTANDPTSQGKGLICIATLWLAEKDKNSATAKKYAESIRYIILTQFNDRITDFTDETVWKQGLINDINPLFIACQWMGCYALSYQYTKPLFTAAEQAKIDSRLKAAAYFSVREMSLGFELTYNNWLEDDLTFRSDAGYRKDEYQNKLSEKIMFDGGPKIPVRGLHYNNRRAEGYKLAALIGIMYNDETLIKYATRFFEDVMRFATMSLKVKDAQGKDRFIVLNCEMERGNNQFSEVGVGYAGAMINTIGDIADWLARSGRPHCINFKTREGNLTTTVPDGYPEKSLENVIDGYNMIFDQEVKLYMRGELLDGQQVSEGWDSEFHATLCNLNLFYKRDDFKDSYMRKAKNGAYHANPDGFGWSSVWMGAGGHVAGKFILHAGLEGKVFPYGGGPIPIPVQEPKLPENFQAEKVTGIVRAEPGPEKDAILIQNVGDKVQKQLTVHSGKYRVKFKARAGGSTGPTAQAGGYFLTIKDQSGKEINHPVNLQGQPVSSQTFGGSTWGDFVSETITLESDTYSFAIEAKVAWIGFYNFTLEPVETPNISAEIVKDLDKMLIGVETMKQELDELKKTISESKVQKVTQ